MFAQRLSQAIAENCNGVVYYFADSTQVPDAMHAAPLTVWAGWELPSLVRNPNVIGIVVVDPFKPYTDPATGLPNPQLVWTPRDGTAGTSEPFGDRLWLQNFPSNPNPPLQVPSQGN